VADDPRLLVTVRVHPRLHGAVPVPDRPIGHVAGIAPSAVELSVVTQPDPALASNRYTCPPTCC